MKDTRRSPIARTERRRVSFSAILNLTNFSPEGLIDSPFTWSAVGLGIGVALGVNSASVWLVALGLGAFVVYLWRRGPAQHDTEGARFATGSLFMIGWIIGFVIHGLAF